MRAWLLLLVLALVACADPDAIGTPPDAVEYRWGEGPFQPLHSMDHDPPGRPEGETTLTLRFTLPELPEDPGMLVTGSRWVVDGRVGGRSLGRPPGELGLFHLRPEDAHARAEVVFESARNIVPRRIAAVSYRRALSALIRAELPTFTIGAALAIGGLALLLAGLGDGRRRASLWLGTFALPVGVSFMCMANWISGFLIGGEGRWTLNGFCTLAHPLGFVAFVHEMFGDSWIVRWEKRVLAAVLVLAAPLHILGVVDVDVFRVRFFPLLLLFMALIVVTVAARARTGDRAARAFLLGFSAMVLAAVPDVLWGMGMPIVLAHIAPFGVLAFAGTMSFVAERRYRAQSRELEASREELETRVDELLTRKTEIETLNDELRIQIEKRSRELRELVTAGAKHVTGGALSPGDLVDGRYRVEEPLGAGAMGAVYRVVRTTDDRELALKVMGSRPNPTRFTREAEIAAQVRHPNVVPVVDVGVTREGLLYLVMELVRGPTLEAERARFGDRAWAKAVLADIACGVEALHARNVVHRDLKPANVLLDEGSTARIADFGVARHDSAATLYATTLAADAPRTSPGALIGTPLYMAPETVRGTVGPAADIFALGLIGCELLTGAHPFATPAVFQELAGTWSSPSLDRIDAEHAAWIGRALDRDPAARPTAAELVRLLT